MSTAASAGMQAALLIREKQRLRRKKYRKGRADLPTHIATKEIGPFPRYPPGFMCSQGRAAWQERERGRRCSLSEEARQHRIKQTEAHHRWMKRNRIHDSTYGGGSDEDDFFNVYHQSAAANALLYVGLGTIAIGSIIFFVGTGEKGFKTLELRLIGPTLVACGLLCCVIRVLLCACPSTCFRKRKKTRLKDSCPHASTRYPLTAKDHHDDFQPADSAAALLKHHKKKVSIVPPTHPQPSTSTTMAELTKEQPLSPPYECHHPHHHHHHHHHHQQQQFGAASATTITTPPQTIPQINLPDVEEASSIIELQTLEFNYDIQSVSSNDSDNTGLETVVEAATSTSIPTTFGLTGVTSATTVARPHQIPIATASKLSRTREPVNSNFDGGGGGGGGVGDGEQHTETCLSVVIEHTSSNDNLRLTPTEISGGSSGGKSDLIHKKSEVGTSSTTEKQQHSGIVLSPLQLGQ